MSLFDRLREAFVAQVELQERMMLRNRPWLEERLHWSWDGEEWRLHGHLPPVDGSPSVTSDGWCPGLRATCSR